MSNYVLCIDTHERPLAPVHPAAARKLLNEGKVAIFRKYPFTLILKTAHPDTPVEPIQLKIDPGSRTTGIALVAGNKVIFGAELTHRGLAIKASLDSRRAIRRGRRARHTRYQQARFLNRARPKGWLAPSLQHRVETILTWINKFIRFAPVGSIAQELVRFNLQQMEHPEISGVEYQQGTLAGYEVREYLLEKWGRKCAYCQKEGIPLQIEHIQPRAKGGTNRISNLTLACESCNQKKGTQDIELFLAKKPDILNRIKSQAKRPLKDAAAVNSTRWALFDRLKETGLPVTTGSGGLTKFNRVRLGLAKSHWLDAACVGAIDMLKVLTARPLLIKCNGHGTRQMCRTDKYGFPNRYVPRFKFVNGFQTGDIVRAVVTSGKKIGCYVGRVAVRTSGSFNISTRDGLVQHAFLLSDRPQKRWIQLSVFYLGVFGRLKPLECVFHPALKRRGCQRYHYFLMQQQTSIAGKYLISSDCISIARPDGFDYIHANHPLFDSLKTFLPRSTEFDIDLSSIDMTGLLTATAKYQHPQLSDVCTDIDLYPARLATISIADKRVRQCQRAGIPADPIVIFWQKLTTSFAPIDCFEFLLGAIGTPALPLTWDGNLIAYIRGSHVVDTPSLDLPAWAPGAKHTQPARRFEVRSLDRVMTTCADLGVLNEVLVRPQDIIGAISTGEIATSEFKVLAQVPENYRERIDDIGLVEVDTQIDGFGNSIYIRRPIDLASAIAASNWTSAYSQGVEVSYKQELEVNLSC